MTLQTFTLGTFAQQGVAAGDFDSIATVTVGAGGSSSISFSSIPTGYKHLQLRGSLQTNRASYIVDNTMVRLNSDSGSNYGRHNVGASAATTTAPEAYGTGSANFAGPIPTPSSVATDRFNGFVLDILDYLDTNKNTTIRILGGYDINGTAGTGSFGGCLYLSSGVWLNTAAVNAVSFTPVDGTQFTQYSTVALYGIKA